MPARQEGHEGVPDQFGLADDEFSELGFDPGGHLGEGLGRDGRGRPGRHVAVVLPALVAGAHLVPPSELK